MTDKSNEWALYMESLWLRHQYRVGRIANIGRIWGTRTEDLKSPLGVLGRVGRTIPEVMELARGFYSEASSVYAEKLLRQELPHIVFGASSEEPQASHALGRGSNHDTEYVVPLLQGIASILALKIEEMPLFHGPDGKVAILAVKLHLGEGIVLGTLLKGSTGASDVYAPILATHPSGEVLARLGALWAEAGVRGIEIRCEESPSTSVANLTLCTFTRMEQPDALVVGHTFANDYARIASRIARFERAGIKRNLMLLGPPGCGKTQVAKQVALALDKFVVVVDSRVLATESSVDTITYFFRNVILICDDFDRFHGDTQSLLAALESTGSSVIVTCNTVWGFDKATIRVGRIDEIIEVPKPDKDMRGRLYAHFHRELRAEELRVNLRREIPPEMDANDLAWAAENTDGFTPAEIRESMKCYRALGFEDFKVDLARIRKQAQIMESLLYDVAWAQNRNGGKTEDKVQTAIDALRNTKVVPTSSDPPGAREADDADDAADDGELKEPLV